MCLQIFDHPQRQENEGQGREDGHWHIRIGDTVQATLAHILDKTDFKVTLSFTGSNLSQQARRNYITDASK